MKKEIKEEIKQQLFTLVDQTYQQFHSNLCPGSNNILGIRVPVLRNYAKELLKQYSYKELLNNIDNEYYEEIMLQGMIIGLSKEKNLKEYLTDIERFIPKIDNWAVCDVFCAGLKMTKKHKEEMWQFIQKYITSSQEFEIRFGVVMLIDYYIEEPYLKQILDNLNTITHTGYYVQMAVAWAISICLIKYYSETIAFLKSKNCKLDKFTYNKSLQKAIESFRISEERKADLRSMKK